MIILIITQTLNLCWNVNRLLKIEYIDVGSRIDPRKIGFTLAYEC